MDEMSRCMASIMYDPLSYIHPQRMCLPKLFDTPRQRGVINDILMHQLGLPARLESVSSILERQLVLNWTQLPYISTLIGAQLLKADLGWEGNLLHLSSSVQFFMSRRLDVAKPHSRYSEEVLEDVQKIGLQHLLLWQLEASETLKKRMALLFPPNLDICFAKQYSLTLPPTEFDFPLLTVSVRECRKVDLFLILQAIQYAKNYSDNV